MASAPDVVKGITGRIGQDLIERKDIAVRQYLERFPDAKPGDIADFEERYLAQQVPALFEGVEYDKDTGF